MQIEFNQVPVGRQFTAWGTKYRRENDLGQVFGIMNALNLETGKMCLMPWKAKVTLIPELERSDNV